MMRSDNQIKLIELKEKKFIAVVKDGIYDLVISSLEDINIHIEKNITASIKIKNNAVNSNIKVDIDEDSTVNIYEIVTLNKNSSDFTVNLNGSNSTVEFSTLLIGNMDDESRQKIRVNHYASFTTSRLINKGVLADKSNCDFEVESHIDKKAHKSKTQQSSKVISLNPEINAKIKPVLLIDNYDVEAGHNATLTRISDNDIYYLQSRGITKKEALKLIISGFLVENLPEYVQKEIEEIIERKMLNE